MSDTMSMDSFGGAEGFLERLFLRYAYRDLPWVRRLMQAEQPPADWDIETDWDIEIGGVVEMVGSTAVIEVHVREGEEWTTVPMMLCMHYCPVQEDDE